MIYVLTRSMGEGIELLEYIESSGTQWIDTGFYANQDSRIVCECLATTPIPTFYFPFGARTSLSYGFDSALTPTQVFYHYGGYNTFQNFSYTASRITIDANQNTCSFITASGSTSITFEKHNFSTQYPVFLFSLNESGASIGTSYAWRGRIYSCQIYDNGTLVHEYLPAKDTGGVICMYDNVEKEYIYNAGTGEFLAGPKV